MIAAGLGCKTGCAVDDIVAAVTRALVCAGKDLTEVHAFYAPDFKQGETSLRSAASRLNKRLVLLPMIALEAQAHAALSSSARVAERFGLPSVAETAALAGAVEQTGARGSARLLGPRSTAGGATCALAIYEEHP